jgi:hypothetical protein
MATATDDEIDIPDAQPQSALAALAAPAVSPEGRAWGENYLKAHPQGVDTKGEAALLQDFSADADAARQTLRQARERLAARRMDPSVLGLRFAQAMLSPSTHGVPDQLSRAVGAVADWRQQNQAFQQQQEDEDTGLAEKLQGVDAQSLKARLALQELQERTQGSMLNTAVRATAQPPKPATPPSHYSLVEHDVVMPDGKTPGKQTYLLDSSTGKVTPYGTPAPAPKAGAAVAGELDDATKDYLYQVWNSTHALPAGYSRQPAMVNTVMAYIAQRAHEEGKTDAEILANSQLLKSQQRAENDFSPGGKLGQALTSTNRVTAHLQDYQDLVKALNNHDLQGVNFVKNKIATWAGDADPTNIQAIAPILGDEIAKSIVPGGGGVTERQEFKDQFSTSKSPQQAAGAVDKYMKFLQDQVEGTEYAYSQLPSHPTDFRTRFLAPRTRAAFGYEHPADSMTAEQRAALIQMIKDKQAAQTGAP